jgi:ATP-dependent Clp protease protease subunit
VHIIGTGWVASAGITIFLAAKKEHRYALPNTRFMIHQPLGGVRGQASDIEIEAKEIIRMLERVNRLIADATGQPVEKVKQDTDRNYWMNPQEAIDYGIVSRVVNSYGDLKLDPLPIPFLCEGDQIHVISFHRRKFHFSECAKFFTLSAMVNTEKRHE